MSVKYQIDDIDRKILSHLVKNARIPFLEIARECGISGAAIHQRVKKMEDSGIIEGSRFIVKPDALGFGVCAFIGVILDHAHTYKTVVKEIESIPEVTECHFITGGFTFLIKLRCNDHQHLMDILINTLQNIPGIAKTETFISLDQLIEKQIALYPQDKYFSSSWIVLGQSLSILQEVLLPLPEIPKYTGLHRYGLYSSLLPK